MAKILEMPKLSPTMEEGVLAVWHKNEGDAVGVDDLLAEVETDKATMEFRAFDSGTLLKRLVDAGADVKLGQPVAILGNKGEDISALLATAQSAQAAAPKAAPPEAKKETREPGEAPQQAEKSASVAPKPAGEAVKPAVIARPPRLLDRTEYLPEPVLPPSSASGNALASPFVRKTARDRGIDLSGIAGSGPHGRIVASDLNAPAPRASVEPPLSSLGDAEVRPLSQMRKTIARRLTESKQTVPHFYLNIDADVGALVELREQINLDLITKSELNSPDKKPLKISVNDLLIKATALALKQVPECNAQFRSDAIVIHRRIDISVAVAVPDGLLTPVVRDADKKSVIAIATEVRELAARAKTKKLAPEEMQNGTFSISNLGMFGVDSFAAVINPPEGAILAVGQVRDEPIVQAGAVVPGRRMGLTLSCDHRVVDGAVGAAFLAALRALIEHPTRILTV